MLSRKTSGSVVCPSCGSLVGVKDDKCYNCGRANPGMWGFAPILRQLGNDLGFVPMVLAVSVALYALSLIMSGGPELGNLNPLSFLSPGRLTMFRLGAAGAFAVVDQGRWWTVLSANWLHWSLLHIVFNMMGVRNLAPALVDIVGPARTAIIYIIGGACGFLLTSLLGTLGIPFIGAAGLSAGASASIFALVGALVHYGRVSGSSFIRTQMTQYAISMFAYGLLFPGIDNTAHAGGFIGGYLLSSWLNPLTREKGDHVLIAAICILASFAAIVASLLVS